jgi:hypothetical protein
MSNALLANSDEIHKIIPPKTKLMAGNEKARGTGGDLGLLVNTGTYAPAIIPVAANTIIRGAPNVRMYIDPGTLKK